MKNLSRLFPVFSIAFVLAYPLADWFSLALFRYYPTIGVFSFKKNPAGNAIQWYGWMATALIVALIASAICAALPPRLAAGRALDYAWIVPAAMLLFSLYIVYAGWWAS
jgi:hypothetical protein